MINKKEPYHYSKRTTVRDSLPTIADSGTKIAFDMALFIVNQE